MEERIVLLVLSPVVNGANYFFLKMSSLTLEKILKNKQIRAWLVEKSKSQSSFWTDTNLILKVFYCSDLYKYIINVGRTTILIIEMY